MSDQRSALCNEPGSRRAGAGNRSSFVLPPSSFASRGFTLVEILVVITILAILTALVIVAGGAARDYAREKEASTAMSTIFAAIESHRMAWGTKAVGGNLGYPPDYRSLGPGSYNLNAPPAGMAPNLEVVCFTYTNTAANAPPSAAGAAVNPDSPDAVLEGWVLANSEVLAYMLTRATGGGPHLKNPSQSWVIAPRYGATAGSLAREWYYPSPSGITCPPGPAAPGIVRRVQLVDPWGVPYVYNYTAPSSVQLQSAGRDRTFRTADDLYFPER